MFSEISFLCGARDFHAIDWYNSAKNFIDKERLSIVTDLIKGEGFEKIIDSSDNIHKLLIIDKILFKKQSSIGKKWRNLIKLIVLPLQVYLLKRHYKKNPNTVYHAHAMYYLWLAHFAGVKFIGTPQGSDLLINPFKSIIYSYLSKRSIKSALFITVDSKQMRDACIKISGIKPFIVQNGIDVASINKVYSCMSLKTYERSLVTSIRGLTSLYRINEIILSRNFNSINESITFIYPFHDEIYKQNISFGINDFDLGRVDKNELYEILLKTKLVVSIPSSDSSPRSVYESIFCGCIVAITYNKYYDILPDCMKRRIIIIDVNDPNWLSFAVEKSDELLRGRRYIPSIEAQNMFNQKNSFGLILDIAESLK